MGRILESFGTPEFWWIAFGFGAQAIFFLRFFVQWVASERSKKSVMPNAFWYLSLLGGLMLFTYAVHRRDPVFIVGQSTGSFIYIRNLVLIYREKRSGKPLDNQTHRATGK